MNGRFLPIAEGSNGMPVTHYIWDEVNDTLLMEKDEAGNTIAEYTHEPAQYGPLISQRRNGQTRYHHFDGQGSTRALTDESGAVTDTYTYTAFGEPVAKSGVTTNPFGYKGALGYYVNPDTSDLYVRARTYQPRVARWLSMDPLFFSRGPARDSVARGNLFQYVGADPVNDADPSGLLQGAILCSLLVGIAAFAKAALGEVIEWIDQRKWETGAGEPDIIGALRGRGLTNSEFDDMDWALDNMAVGRFVKDLAYWFTGGSKNDRYLHCKTSCDMTRECGSGLVTLLLGAANEIGDELWHTGWEMGDMVANEVGVGCGVIAREFDRKFPIPWWVPLSRPDSCDRCCRCFGYKP